MSEHKSDDDNCSLWINIILLGPLTTIFLGVVIGAMFGDPLWGSWNGYLFKASVNDRLETLLLIIVIIGLITTAIETLWWEEEISGPCVATHVLMAAAFPMMQGLETSINDANDLGLVTVVYLAYLLIVGVKAIVCHFNGTDALISVAVGCMLGTAFFFYGEFLTVGDMIDSGLIVDSNGNNLEELKSTYLYCIFAMVILPLLTAILSVMGKARASFITCLLSIVAAIASLYFYGFDRLMDQNPMLLSLFVLCVALPIVNLIAKKKDVAIANAVAKEKRNVNNIKKVNENSDKISNSTSVKLQKLLDKNKLFR